MTGFFPWGCDEAQSYACTASPFPPRSHLPSPSFELFKRRFIQFSKIAESGQCGSYVSSEVIRRWFGQRVASCCPWCFHLLWIRKCTRQLLLPFNSYLSVSSEAGRPPREWRTLLSVFCPCPSLGTRLYLETVLKTVKTHPVSDSRKFSFGISFWYLVFGIITTCILTWWNPLSMIYFFWRRAKFNLPPPTGPHCVAMAI